MTALPQEADHAAEVARRASELRTPSPGVSRLIGLIEDPRSSATQVEDAVRDDPVLTAKLLKLANSPIFRGSQDVLSVREAVVRLGIRQLFGVAILSALKDALPSVVEGYDMGAARFLEHSLIVARLSQSFAPGFGEDAAACFTAGLLHDVGKLAMGPGVEGVRQSVDDALERGDASLDEIEVRLFGFNHGWAGGVVCRTWKLPPAFSQVCEYHHAPQSAERPYRKQAAVVHIADATAHALGFGFDRAGLLRRVVPEATSLLKVGPDDLERLIATHVTQLEGIAQMANSM